MDLTDRSALKVPAFEHIALERPGMQGQSIALLDWGAPHAGAPEVILAHANGFCAPMWAITAATLSEHCHVLAYDARGHGRSNTDTSVASLHWNVMHDDLIELLDGLRASGRIRGPVTAVGHSMGGAAVLCVAARRADLIARLVALDPVVWWPEMLQRSTANTRKDALVAGARRRREQFADRAAALAAWRGRGIFADWDDAVLQAYVQYALVDDDEGGVRLACAPRTEATIFDANWHEDMRALARAICAPGIVVHATQGHFRRALHEELVELSPTLVLRDYDGTHFFPMADPVATAHLILEQING